MISSIFQMKKPNRRKVKNRRFFQHDVRLKDQENSSCMNLENQYAIVQQKFKPLNASSIGTGNNNNNNKKKRKKKKQLIQNPQQQLQHQPQHNNHIHLPTNAPQMLVCHCSCAGVAATGNQNTKNHSVLLSSFNKNNIQQWQELFLNSSGVSSFHQNNVRSFVRCDFLSQFMTISKFIFFFIILIVIIEIYLIFTVFVKRIKLLKLNKKRMLG